MTKIVGRQLRPLVRVWFMVVPLSLVLGGWMSLGQKPSKSSPSSQYRWVVDYFTFGPTGRFVSKQRVAARYRKSTDGTVEWSNVTIASGSSLEGEFASPSSQSYMQGFSYRPTADVLLKAEFFRGFPLGGEAMLAKNLVWDTFMFEIFAERITQVTQASPYRFPREDIPLAGSGTFQNTNLELTRAGRVHWKRQRLEILHYEAFFNKVDVDIPGMKLTGRSDYWGDVWVSPKRIEVERATLYEELIGEIRLPSQSTPQAINVVRKGLVEKVSDR